MPDATEGTPGLSGSEGFQQAAGEAVRSAGGVVDRWLMLAGRSVLLRFAGPAMLPSVMPAFGHLTTDPPGDGSAPDLTVWIWDGASTGVTPGLPPDPVDPRTASAWYLHEQPPLRIAYRPGWRALYAYEADRPVAWHWVGDADRVPYWDVSTPLRAILHWWAGDRGDQLVHAGAVATDDGGVLFAGRSGSGKSTTTLACLASGMRYAGDDYVVLRDGPQPEVHSLYCSGKLENEQARRFPELLPAIANEGAVSDEKSLGFLDRVYPGAMAASFPLRAILLPRVVEQERARLVPVPRRAALAGLAPSTIFQMPGSRDRELASMARVVNAVPAFMLELGSDLRSVTDAVREACR